MTSRQTLPTVVPTRTNPRPGRVCLVIGQLGLGGAEKQLALLAAGLRRRGVDSVVVVLRHGGPREQILRGAGVPVVYLGLPSHRPVWRVPVVAILAFIKLTVALRRLRPEVVHAFLYHGYVLTAPAALLARVPVCIAGRRSLCDFLVGHPVATGLERLANRMTDLLIANAEAVADDVVRIGHVPRSKIRIVHNGLPDEAFEPHPPAALETPWPVVLCLASLRTHKGHAYLLDAAARLRENGVLCTLALAGDGPERAPLQRQADRLGLDVRFLGSRTDVPALLARADLVVLPSLTEGMSNAVMEAMAAGKPVVATDVGGTAELLRDRGVLVPPADAQALAEGMRRVLCDDTTARDLAAAARDWSWRNLRLDVMVEHHQTIYRELLERRCAG